MCCFQRLRFAGHPGSKPRDRYDSFSKRVEIRSTLQPSLEVCCLMSFCARLLQRRRILVWFFENAWVHGLFLLDGVRACPLTCCCCVATVHCHGRWSLAPHHRLSLLLVLSVGCALLFAWLCFAIVDFMFWNRKDGRIQIHAHATCGFAR